MHDLATVAPNITLLRGLSQGREIGKCDRKPIVATPSDSLPSHTLSPKSFHCKVSESTRADLNLLRNVFGGSMRVLTVTVTVTVTATMPKWGYCTRNRFGNSCATQCLRLDFFELFETLNVRVEIVALPCFKPGAGAGKSHQQLDVKLNSNHHVQGPYSTFQTTVG